MRENRHGERAPTLARLFNPPRRRRQSTTWTINSSFLPVVAARRGKTNDLIPPQELRRAGTIVAVDRSTRLLALSFSFCHSDYDHSTPPYTCTYSRVCVCVCVSVCVHVCSNRMGTKNTEEAARNSLNVRFYGKN